MPLENTWRWFGPQDAVSLAHVRQTGATGIVTALHHIPVGELWSVDEIVNRKQVIEAHGLTWSVAESIPVHEEIKKRNGNYRRYVDNYKQSIANLGRSGIDTLCYNFMPVLDWSRTDLRVENKDGSITTRFESRAFAAFDLFILDRQGAEGDYTDGQVRQAREYFGRLSEDQRQTLIRTVLLGHPGSGGTYTLTEFKEAIEPYRSISESEFREHLYEFIREIVPVAEEAGVRLAIHPDDPPRRLLGLPRIVSTEQDLAKLLGVNDSTTNGLTFCAGSLAADARNDPVSMAERFARRISFVHLRSVSKNADGDFVETDHLQGDVDMFRVMKALVLELKRRENEGMKNKRLPLRPDHGHFMLADKNFAEVYPGYSLFGRMRGLAELRGLEEGVRRSLDA